MLTLGIDTSNYATSLAVYDTVAEEVVCDIKRFLPVKKGELGLRQSDALFHHTQVLPELLSQLFKQADSSKIKAVGVSVKPRPVDGSYMPCFLAGLNAATAFATALNIPIVKTTHQQGHVAAALCALKNSALFSKEILVFHISGGTTELLLCNGFEVVKKIGESSDLYAGQAVDRVGAKLGFDFPSGVMVSQTATTCAESIKPKISVKGANCSLSGLENQCNKLLSDNAPVNYVAKYCLSYIGHTVVAMIKSALIEYPNAHIICAGGVMCSETIKEIVQNYDKSIMFVDAKYSSDNAIGVSVIAAKEAFYDRGN